MTRSSLRNALLALLLLSPLTAWAAPRDLLTQNSRIEFSVVQMGVAVSGEFRRFSGKLDLDDDQLAKAYARISVDVGSLSTGDADADAVALDLPWLASARFPQARFASQSIRAEGADRYRVDGTLTIRGQSRAVSVPLRTEAAADGGLIAQGEFSIKRSDFEIGGGEWNEGDLVADEVSVRFKLRFGAAR